jgi:amino acid transporter
MALQYLFGISIAIAILIVIVSVSYRKAIHLYPSGGGSYTVARDNLGTFPGMLAASALFIDYILTVAVSVSAGVENLAAGWKELHGGFDIYGFYLPWTVPICIFFLLLVAFINVRGTKESGWLFAFPAYLFLTMIMLVIGFTAFKYFGGTLVPYPSPAPHETAMATKGLMLMVVLKAFASGCSALTGVEAVSNGVSAFEPPEAKNASKTLLLLMIGLVMMFMGTSICTIVYNVHMTENQTVISLISSAAFGSSITGVYLYGGMKIATLLILLIAANTSFAGFPRLLAIVAKDGFAPKAFASLGDRLVHTRGIFALTFFSILLIIMYKGNTNSLIPLYAVGVFICFTLSQLGMAKKSKVMALKGWQQTMAINIFGAVVTGAVALIQAITKFQDGAWLVVAILPILITISYSIHKHYEWFDKIMIVSPDDYNPFTEKPEPLTVLVLISSDIHRGILEGLECGRSIITGRPDSILRAVHIEIDPEKTPRLKKKWELLIEPYAGNSIRLDIVPSPFRWLIEPINEYLDNIDLERKNDRIIIVLPEFETGTFITHLLHNFSAYRLRSMLLKRPNITVVSSRFFMKPMSWRLGRGGLVF